jgi:hypothetical protein
MSSTAETQQGISDWAEATFGPAASDIRVAARANEEMAELLRAVTTGNVEKAPEEAADVVIVLARLATRLKCAYDLSERCPVQAGRGPAWYAMRANVNLAVAASLIEEEAKPSLGSVPWRLQRCVYYLATMVEVLGTPPATTTTLQTEIDKKMAINRARKWSLDGSGHGYHVRPTKEVAS